jgi:UDP-N-acetylbacillosamine N-acetyltransferase
MKSLNDNTKIFIWGASGHALFILNILSFHKDIKVVGLIDDVSPHRAGKDFHGFRILGGREVFPYLKEQGVTNSIFGFGNCSARLRLAELLTAEGFELLSAIHPLSAIASSAKIGKGCAVGPGVVVDANCTIEENCILNNNTCISHGSFIASGVHLCPGTTIGGDVVIGRGSWIGIGSTIIEKVKIGAGCFIGAGAVVVHDIPDNVLVYGVPAKIIRPISPIF